MYATIFQFKFLFVNTLYRQYYYKPNWTHKFKCMCGKKKSCILANFYRSKPLITRCCLSSLRTASRHVFFVIIGQKQIPYVIILIVFLLHFNLSDTPIKNINCFILLGRHYIQVISFFTTASWFVKTPSTMRCFSLKRTWPSVYNLCGWPSGPFARSHTLTLSEQDFPFHYKLLSLSFAPIIYPIEVCVLRLISPGPFRRN